jgi:hypothetical protein
LSPVYSLPVGSLHDRFTGSLGWTVFLGKQTSAIWTWTGRCEYVEWTNINTAKLTKAVTIQENGQNYRYDVPLPRLSMKLKALSLTAEAHAGLLTLAGLETDLYVGFGFTYWDNMRSAYVDSLFVQSSATGNTIKVATLAVPAGSQFDWSGTVTIGCDVSLSLVDPIWLTLGADYKLIIGELWQALDLDLEGVSGLQSIGLRAGVTLRF